MFTNEAQVVIDRAKDVAAPRAEAQLTLAAIGIALVLDRRGVQLLAECFGVAPDQMRRLLPAPEVLQRPPSKLPLAEEVRSMLSFAKDLVRKVPFPSHPSLIALPHLSCAVAHALRVGQLPRPDLERITDLLSKWSEEEGRPPSLGDLTRRFRALRQELLSRVYGQEHAVHSFLDGLFNIEVTREADIARRKPAGIFVFAGPPGVGKTYLAELGASHLDRPFRRFDMTSYAHGHETTSLIGTPKVYHGAQPGNLTEFVQRNPNALLLFDEIEKAHHTAIQLFLQILDAGRLQDKYMEQEVEFRNTILIFTTNVGRSLYENENSAGVHAANAAFHRSTILDALRTELDPYTRTPFFPAAICSRIATGYPILFNKLRIEDLARIARSELARVATLLERQHGQHFVVAEEIPLALVMREGAQTDARTINARAEAFLKEEVFKACQLFADEHVDIAFGSIQNVVVEVDPDHAGEVAERIFADPQRPSVLFVGDAFLGSFYADAIPAMDWHLAANPEQVFDLLTKRTIDFVLLDLAIEPDQPLTPPDLNAAVHDIAAPSLHRKTELHFDYTPLAARRYVVGQRLLEQIRGRMPEVPVYLFSLDRDNASESRPGIDEELLSACVRAGGARGAIRTSLGGRDSIKWEHEREALRAQLERVTQQIRKEHAAAEMARQNQVIMFDTAPALSEDGKHLQIRCRNFRLVRATLSSDASALLSDVERPNTRFADVIGATGAKEAMIFLREWLRDPKKYAAAGVEPPRGVLLTGSPGTGKTMLARALAGESDCAFLAEAGTNFVTKYQGSGPESIRELFARARRYAPAIVFIDEIDAIGVHRADVKTGFVGHGEAMALNQLLVEMDGFAKATAKPVIIIAATNYPERLDPALLRRFSRVIEVELPTCSERELYLRRRLEAKAKHLVSPEMLERLAAQSQGLSIADLERVLAQAAVMSLANEGVINDTILSEAFERITMGEAKGGTDILRTARHEAGHALVMCALGHPPIYVTVVGRANFGGYAAMEDKEERRSRTKKELEDLICQVLAGREAEKLYYGEEEGESTGPSNDLERATGIAEAMVYELGMSKEIGPVRLDRRRPLPGDLGERCHKAVREIIESQSELARCILTEQRQGLDRTAQALIERNRLLKHELLELVSRHHDSQVLMKEAG